MKRLKSNARNRLGGETWDACLRLSTTNINVDAEKLFNATTIKRVCRPTTKDFVLCCAVHLFLVLIQYHRNVTTVILGTSVAHDQCKNNIVAPDAGNLGSPWYRVPK